MKKIALAPLMAVLIMALLAGCNGTTNTSGDDTTDKTEDVADENKKSNDKKGDKVKKGAKVTALFAQVPVWKNASSKDWLDNVSIGATMDYLGETVIDSTGDRPQTYLKVETSNGKIGWVNGYHGELDTKPGVTIKDASIYKSPDLIEITEKTIDEMSIVAIKEIKDDWAEVAYTNLSNWGKWTVWVQASDISQEKHDIGAASVYHKMINQKNEKTEAEKLEKILEMIEPFEASDFYGIIQNKYNDALEAGEEEPAEEEEVEEEEAH